MYFFKSSVIFHVHSGKKSEIWIIMEYCPHGNLREFLRNSRSRYSIDENDMITDLSKVFGPKNLIHFGLQITKGMNFLISRKVIFFIAIGKEYHIVSKIVVGFFTCFLAGDSPRSGCTKYFDW